MFMVISIDTPGQDRPSPDRIISVKVRADRSDKTKFSKFTGTARIQGFPDEVLRGYELRDVSIAGEGYIRRGGINFRMTQPKNPSFWLNIVLC